MERSTRTVNRKGSTKMDKSARVMVFTLTAVGFEMYEAGDVAHLPLVFVAILVALMHDAVMAEH